jgi:hypothetical protein
VGRRNCQLASRSLMISLPSGVPASLGSVIDAVVAGELGAFAQRQRGRSVVRSQNDAEITDWLLEGKVTFGGDVSTANVDVVAAQSAARVAFSDGLFQVIVDDRSVDDLDDVVTLWPSSRVMFLRLVALAGG